MRQPALWGVIAVCVIVIGGVSAVRSLADSVSFSRAESAIAQSDAAPNSASPVDTATYDKKMQQLANYGTTSTSTVSRLCKKTGTNKKKVCTTVVKPILRLWPPKPVYPNAGAVLPYHRVVAYYGNFYSKGMGILGKYPPDEMLTRLKAAVKQWQNADPSTPVIPAIHYIVVTAQASKGPDGKYRLRMPDDQIQKAIDLAAKVNGLVFLDVQVGLSNLHAELPLLEPFLKLPQVHLGIDPEFSMKDGVPPGKEIGTYNSGDVNYAANFLADIVRKNNLTPKILIIHRFTQDMVTGAKSIKPLPEVQIVMDMDGWGSRAKKIGTYTNIVAAEPIQFTGFKLFYSNDARPPSTGLLSPKQVLLLQPQPIYIQYQ